VDGTTITGDGTPAAPLIAVGSGGNYATEEYVDTQVSAVQARAEEFFVQLSNCKLRWKTKHRKDSFLLPMDSMTFRERKIIES
jgi:hypothetical protein